MKERNLKNWDSLLSDITTGLQAMPTAKIWNLEVIFVCPDKSTYTFDLCSALTAISSDLYWDQRGNWSEATRAAIHTV